MVGRAVTDGHRRRDRTERRTAPPSGTAYLDEYVFGALRAGASGFLLKDASREHLIEAIRVLHAATRGCRPPSPDA